MEILATLSFVQLVALLFGLMVAAKELTGLLDYFYLLVRKHFDKEYKTTEEKAELLRRFELNEANDERRNEEYKKLEETLMEAIARLDARMDAQDEKIQQLLDSDKNAIKAWIVREYHFFKEQQGWVDDFSMDTIERRFGNYEKEGGNSYVHSLIEELRKMPKKPPTSNE